MAWLVLAIKLAVSASWQKFMLTGKRAKVAMSDAQLVTCRTTSSR